MASKTTKTILKSGDTITVTWTIGSGTFQAGTLIVADGMDYSGFYPRQMDENPSSKNYGKESYDPSDGVNYADISKAWSDLKKDGWICIDEADNVSDDWNPSSR